MRKAGIVKKITILVMILALPGFLYYLLTAKGKNRYKPLPFFGTKQLAKTNHRLHGKNIPDTIYHQLSNFSLISQDGETVKAALFNKKIFIANFFYTRCPSVCSTVISNMSNLSKIYAKNKMVYFTSITVDPQHDTPKILKLYAAKYKPGKQWLFLTGDTAGIYNLARNGFLVDALNAGNGNYIYSDKLILIDAAKRIRGYYSGTSTTDVARLNDEIKVLIAEELRKVDKALY